MPYFRTYLASLDSCKIDLNFHNFSLQFRLNYMHNFILLEVIFQILTTNIKYIFLRTLLRTGLG